MKGIEKLQRNPDQWKARMPITRQIFGYHDDNGKREAIHVYVHHKPETACGPKDSVNTRG